MSKKECIALSDMVDDMGCGNNSGGIVVVAAFFHSDVKTWPQEKMSQTTMADAAELEGDLVFQDGKKAARIVLPPNHGSFTISEQGEMGGMSQLEELSIFQNGISADFLGMMGITKNARMGFVVKDANGQMYLMGDADTAAMRVPGDGVTTGSARTDLRQQNMKFAYPCNTPMVYTGDFKALFKPAPGAP